MSFLESFFTINGGFKMVKKLFLGVLMFVSLRCASNSEVSSVNESVIDACSVFTNEEIQSMTGIKSNLTEYGFSPPGSNVGKRQCTYKGQFAEITIAVLNQTYGTETTSQSIEEIRNAYEQINKIKSDLNTSILKILPDLGQAALLHINLIHGGGLLQSELNIRTEKNQLRTSITANKQALGEKKLEEVTIKLSKELVSRINGGKFKIIN